jgi:capsular exopolysaccharide synthesis family protein
VLLITSPASGDGKSSFAINLATSFTQAQRSVLVIGADMRRPRLHSLFPPEQHQDNFGLSSVLSGAASADEALRHHLTECPERLSVLSCGPIPENPAELLGSPAFREMLGTLRRRFDVIIVDSPPVLPVVDPVVIAGVADAVIMVARCRTTTREQLRVALTELRQVDTNILGVVLNDLSDSDREGGYTYAQSYYRDERASLIEEPARTTGA